MFRVVTISRECGSGGGIIARNLAKKLKWNLLDRALIAEVARSAQVDAAIVGRYDEHVDSFWHRFNRGGLWSSAIVAGIAPEDAQIFDAETVAWFAQRAILKAAETGGCVIVGRGAECVLQDREGVLHVFIYGPWAERLERVRARAEPSQDAEDLIQGTDHERASYVRTFYGCDWKDPHLYQMMLSSELGTERIVSMIVEAVEGGSRT